MPLELKTTHKPVRDYYKHLDEFQKLGVKHEGAVRAAFQRLLEHCCRQVKLTFVGEYKLRRPGRRPISLDGAFIDDLTIPHGFWEAKDTQDDLAKEVQNKFRDGYPTDNIVFQAPTRAILWQNSVQVCDEDITKPDALVYVVRELFAYRTEIQRDWEIAVEEFKKSIPDAAGRFIELIEEERRENPRFTRAFNSFGEVCRSSINPNLSDKAIEEMLIQHLLTERIFRKIFQNPDFTRRNIIAREIEKVIEALVSRKFNRDEFLRPLDRFYVALEERAESLGDYHQKQTFLNTVYEKFFQGYAVKVADTHGIVYTPQPIVDFMVRSVEEILKKEFGRSLSDEGVHIIDPFVGTGNFITRIMREIKTTVLPHKYANELHCNEVMLLPYYIASMNIEHEYYERTGQYQPFEGICLVDTFELAEDKQLSLMFTEENTERVEKLRKTRLFVIIANPPYNTAQVDENDNNKNRKYTTMDGRVVETYSADSKATLHSKLRDPYVKAIRWASDKILENGEGVVAFVCNSSFVDNVAFDGMRKHLREDFNFLRIIDLKGNIRKDSMRDGIPLGEKHTVFGLSAMVGVSILFLIKKKESENHNVLYAETDLRATRLEKFRFLESLEHVYNVPPRLLQPDSKHTWLRDGLQSDFDTLVPLGHKQQAAEKLFQIHSCGVCSNNDAYVFGSDSQQVAERSRKMVESYMTELDRAHRVGIGEKPEDFLRVDVSSLKWVRHTKQCLSRGTKAAFSKDRIRLAMYRPFFKQFYYFDRTFNENVYMMPCIFPFPTTEAKNRVICAGAYGRKKFAVFMVNIIPDLNFYADPQQSFPFYIYDENGTDQRENITDWAVGQFTSALGTDVTKWQIFHYIYGVLHSPEYRKKYEANLKRELPRIPLPKDIESFRAFVAAGERLGELHVNYESQS